MIESDQILQLLWTVARSRGYSCQLIASTQSRSTGSCHLRWRPAIFDACGHLSANSARRATPSRVLDVKIRVSTFITNAEMSLLIRARAREDSIIGS